MNDLTIPKVGLGTYGLTGDSGTKAVLSAIEIGYRHLDTAQTYDGQANQPVAAGLQQGILAARLVH